MDHILPLFSLDAICWSEILREVYYIACPYVLSSLCLTAVLVVVSGFWIKLTTPSHYSNSSREGGRPHEGSGTEHKERNSASTCGKHSAVCSEVNTSHCKPVLSSTLQCSGVSSRGDNNNSDNMSTSSTSSVIGTTTSEDCSKICSENDGVDDQARGIRVDGTAEQQGSTTEGSVTKDTSKDSDQDGNVTEDSTECDDDNSNNSSNSLKLSDIRQQMQQQMTDEEKKQEIITEAQQMSAILSLLKQNEEKFGQSTIEDIRSQMKLYM